MTPRLLRLLSPTTVFLCATAIAQIPNLPDVDAFNPENGHTYRLLFLRPRLTWDNARVVAFSQTLNGVRGHLATITSESEQRFIEQLANSSMWYRETLWLGGFQPSGSPEPDGSWQWVTGEPFTYSNWYRSLLTGELLEPNDDSPYLNDGKGEYLSEMYPDIVGSNGVPTRYWNDNSAKDSGGLGLNNLRPFIIEFTPGYHPRLEGSDLLNWQRSLGFRPGQFKFFHPADFNGDLEIDAVDLQLWRTSVPEPTSTSLLVTVAGLALWLQRAARRRCVV
jgi:hypothetical protein